MSEAKYIDLKSLLYSRCNSYEKLLQFVETNLDIRLSDCKYNEILHRKDNSVITLSELTEMCNEN